ncbi:MAG: hypothetical protein IRZ16_10480 [Myxococcaceae bacterium]|nr:hypothetical protein [Myxococcaceae bacterium]
MDAERAREELERELRELVSIPAPRVVMEFEALDEPNLRLESADFLLDGRPIAPPGVDVLHQPAAPSEAEAGRRRRAHDFRLGPAETGRAGAFTRRQAALTPPRRDGNQKAHAFVPLAPPIGVRLDVVCFLEVTRLGEARPGRRRGR